MTIVAAQSVSGFFHEVVEDAMKTRRVEATEGATRYLVALLADYAHPDGRPGEALERPLTLLLDEALHAPRRRRALRAAADARRRGPLRLRLLRRPLRGPRGRPRVPAGPGHASLRSGELDAARAARTARATTCSASWPRSSASSSRCVADVADATIAMGTDSPRGLLKVYERWLKTGSERLASALTSRGVVPDARAAGRLAVSGARSASPATESRSCASGRSPRDVQAAPRARLPARPRGRRGRLRPRRRRRGARSAAASARRTTARSR